MKIIKTTETSFFEFVQKNIIFEIPSSMRTILMRSSSNLRRYHLCLPRMRFIVSISQQLCFQGVFLGGDGEVYPMLLPNVFTNGFICLGLDDSSIKKIVYDKEKLLPDDVIADNIYSNFIQSEFTYDGAIMSYFFDNDSRYKNKRDFYTDFYTEWSSRGRNYDICSDVRVKSYRDVLFSDEVYRYVWQALHDEMSTNHQD